MIVEEPTTEQFRRVAEHARSLREVAAWVARADERGSREQHAAGRAAAPRLAILGPMSPRGGASGAQGLSRRGHLASMGSALEAQAESLVRAATSRDLAELSQTLGDTGALCASCHQQLRWTH